jgi:tRNA (Guanine-1)-methyltransferase
MRTALLSRLKPRPTKMEDLSTNAEVRDGSPEEGPIRTEVGVGPVEALPREVGAGPRAIVADRGILDCPHYTRPQSFRGWEVPDVLMSGNHEEIRRWRAKKALEKTLRNRPELLEGS